MDLEKAMNDAMAEAQRSMEANSAADQARGARRAAHGVRPFMRRAPGPGAPVCPRCGQQDDWYQYMDTGELICRCEVPD